MSDAAEPFPMPPAAYRREYPDPNRDKTTFAFGITKNRYVETTIQWKISDTQATADKLGIEVICVGVDQWAWKHPIPSDTPGDATVTIHGIYASRRDAMDAAERYYMEEWTKEVIAKHK